MATRFPSHQLSSGLYVSGRPEQPAKERPPTMSSRAVPYTGGDVKKSGELGKMFDIPGVGSGSGSNSGSGPVPGHPPVLKPTRLSNSSQQTSGSVRSGPNSGPVKKTSGSGPMAVLQPTGLITSGPLGSSAGRRPGQPDPTGQSGKVVYGPAVTSLTEERRFGFKVSKVAMWAFLVMVLMGLVVGVFLMVAVKKALILVMVVAVFVPVVIIFLWNLAWRKRGLLRFLREYPSSELREPIDGQYVKVTGVVTCGSIPLESPFQKVPRCVYVSAELYEYRGWGGKLANPQHHFFTWGCRNSEKYVADFYISDAATGLRALVKAGYGARVVPFVKSETVVDVTKNNKDLSPNFLSWLSDRSLSSDDRVMRLKEGYIKEGSTVSVMGVVRRNENVVMIVPPREPTSTGCRWASCLLPTYVEGLILTCQENQNVDVIAV
ncbi:hypothetical protein DCAR_0102283 [Daucus carota subsp. sativus]|uniref:Uncharacterized protein n=1 Tax=Daucus carota subsp. sativus TaxID=79200 RepID=A0A162AIE8_DAUCS|nr:PREDICTED: uncharacterized membrane protein At1g16860-like [Daucus carota subsp. sativus]WOG83109.1 hypothetical protein DCAR_0102283 [Daucus carota subsp. sativus]